MGFDSAKERKTAEHLPYDFEPQTVSSRKRNCELHSKSHGETAAVIMHHFAGELLVFLLPPVKETESTKRRNQNNPQPPRVHCQFSFSTEQSSSTEQLLRNHTAGLSQNSQTGLYVDRSTQSDMFSDQSSELVDQLFSSYARTIVHAMKSGSILSAVKLEKDSQSRDSAISCSHAHNFEVMIDLLMQRCIPTNAFSKDAFVNAWRMI